MESRDVTTTGDNELGWSYQLDIDGPFLLADSSIIFGGSGEQFSIDNSLARLPGTYLESSTLTPTNYVQFNSVDQFIASLKLGGDPAGKALTESFDMTYSQGVLLFAPKADGGSIGSRTFTLNLGTQSPKPELILTAATEGLDPLQVAASLDYKGEFQQATIELDDASTYAYYADGDASNRGAQVYYQGGKVYARISAVDDPTTLNVDESIQNSVVVSADMEAGRSAGNWALSAIIGGGSDYTLADADTVVPAVFYLPFSYTENGTITHYATTHWAGSGKTLTQIAADIKALNFVADAYYTEVATGGIRLNIEFEPVAGRTYNSNQFIVDVAGNTEANGGLSVQSVSDNMAPTAQALTDAINAKINGGVGTPETAAVIRIAGDFTANTKIADGSGVEAIFNYSGQSDGSYASGGASWYGFYGQSGINYLSNEGFAPDLGSFYDQATLADLLNYIESLPLFDTAVIDSNGDIVITTTGKGADTNLSVSLYVNTAEFFAASGVTVQYPYAEGGGQGANGSISSPDPILSQLLDRATYDAATGTITLTAKNAGKETFNVTDASLDYQGVKQIATVSLDSASTYDTTFVDGNTTDDPTTREVAVYYSGGKAYLTITPTNGVTDGTPVVVSADMVPDQPARYVIANFFMQAPQTKFNFYGTVLNGAQSSSQIGIWDYESADYQSPEDILAAAQIAPAFDGWLTFSRVGDDLVVESVPTGPTVNVTFDIQMWSVENPAQNGFAYEYAGRDASGSAGAEPTAQALVDAIIAKTGEGGDLAGIVGAVTRDGTTITIESATNTTQAFKVSDITLDYQGQYQIAEVDFVDGQSADMAIYSGGQVSVTIDTTPGEAGGTETVSVAMGEDLQTTLNALAAEIEGRAAGTITLGANGLDSLLKGLISDVTVNGSSITITSGAKTEHAFDITGATFTEVPTYQEAAAIFSTDDTRYYEGGTIGLTINGVAIAPVAMVAGKAGDTLTALKTAIETAIAGDPSGLGAKLMPTVELVGGKFTFTAKNDADGYGEIDITKVFMGIPAQAQVTEIDLSNITFADDRVDNNGDLPQTSLSVAGKVITAGVGTSAADSVRELAQAIIEARDGVYSTSLVTGFEFGEDYILSSGDGLAADTPLDYAHITGKLQVNGEDVLFDFTPDLAETGVGTGSTVADFVAYLDGKSEITAELVNGQIVIHSEPVGSVIGSATDLDFAVQTSTRVTAPITEIANAVGKVDYNDATGIVLTGKNPGADQLQVGSFVTEQESATSSPQIVEILFFNDASIDNLTAGSQISLSIHGVPTTITVDPSTLPQGANPSAIYATQLLEALKTDHPGLLSNNSGVTSIETGQTLLTLQAVLNGRQVLGDINSDVTISVKYNTGTVQAPNYTSITPAALAEKQSGSLVYEASSQAATVNDATGEGLVAKTGRVEGILSYAEQAGNGGAGAASTVDYTFVDGEDVPLSFYGEDQQSEFYGLLDIDDQVIEGDSEDTQIADWTNVSDNTNFLGDSALTGSSGIDQQFVNPGDGQTAGTNANYFGDAPSTGASGGVNQTYTNPDNGYDAVSGSPVLNGEDANNGDVDLFGSDPGHYLDDGLYTSYLDGGTPRDAIYRITLPNSAGWTADTVLTAGVVDISLDGTPAGIVRFEYSVGDTLEAFLQSIVDSSATDAITGYTISQTGAVSILLTQAASVTSVPELAYALLSDGDGPLNNIDYNSVTFYPNEAAPVVGALTQYVYAIDRLDIGDGSGNDGGLAGVAETTLSDSTSGEDNFAVDQTDKGFAPFTGNAGVNILTTLNQGADIINNFQVGGVSFTWTGKDGYSVVGHFSYDLDYAYTGMNPYGSSHLIGAWGAQGAIENFGIVDMDVSIYDPQGNLIGMYDQVLDDGDRIPEDIDVTYPFLNFAFDPQTGRIVPGPDGIDIGFDDGQLVNYLYGEDVNNLSLTSGMGNILDSSAPLLNGFDVVNGGEGDFIALEGALAASTLFDDPNDPTDGIEVIEAASRLLRIPDPIVSFDLSTNEFGIVSSHSNYLDETAIGNAESVANLLNSVFDFSETTDAIGDTIANTSIFAVTAANDPSVTAIWVHTQSFAGDNTVEDYELNLLATVNTIGGEFGVSNFDILQSQPTV